MQKQYNVAIVGATGAVGERMRLILEERQFPVGSLRLLASRRSRGTRLSFQGRVVEVEELRSDSFNDIDIALFSAGSEVSGEFAPVAAKAGAIVIDNSSRFRMDEDVPLVVPEVNMSDAMSHSGIIANPNCSTIQMVVALKPLYDAYGLQRVVVSTYQAVSGSGRRAVAELERQTAEIAAGKPPTFEVYPRQIVGNVLPHIDVFGQGGYTREELKMIEETRKIMHLPELKITATTVRVPVVTGHSESVNAEFERPIPNLEHVREVLAGAPGVELVDAPEKGEYPTAIEAAGKDEVFVGRLRLDTSVPSGINLWIVSDNLRKGAALNAVQIAEALVG